MASPVAGGAATRHLGLGLLVLLALAPTGPVAAQGVLFTGRVALRHPVDVRIEVVGTDTHVVASRAGHTAEVSLAGVLTTAEVERLVTTAGPVAIVQATSPERSFAALITDGGAGPRIVWSSRTDLHGDPGERVAGALETTDRTGDGLPDVVVGERRDGVSVCGSPLALLYPQALDATGALRAVALRRVGESVEVTATPLSPGPSSPPIGSALRMTSSSSAIGVVDASGLTVPRGLTDGDPVTGWVEGRGGAGSGELVSARFDAPRPIRAFAIRASTAPGVEPPHTLWIVGDTGPALHVTLPTAPFDRVYVVPPAPVAWSCVSVVIDAGSSEAPGLHVGLSELEAYTDIDFEGGIGALVDALVAEQDGADATTEWLMRAGVPAIEALTSAWDRLSTLGHHRAVRVAARHAREAAASALFVLAAEGADAEVRTEAVAALTHAGAIGATTLVAIAAGAGAGAEDAARALGTSNEAFALPPLLAALEGDGANRPGLRAAIGACLAREPRADAGAALEGWLPTASPAALASVALGLAEPRPDLARALIERAITGEATFVERYRLATAAAAAEPSATIDAWLADVAQHADEWMLRDAALIAVGPRRHAVVEAALADPYPRVRRQAVTMLQADANATAALLDRGGHDRWPMVRVAALEGLDGRAEGPAAHREALADDSPLVRERMIQLLAGHEDREAWPLVRARLLDDDEFPRVIAAGLGYVSALCRQDAADAIDRVMVRGTRESAWAPDTDVAVLALRVALRLGGETAERARTIALRSTQAESFQPVLEGHDALPACGDR